MLIRGNPSRFRSTRTSIFHCNGVDLYSFRSQFLYSSTSTPAPTHFLVKYLVDTLGFSNEEAASTSSKDRFGPNLNNKKKPGTLALQRAARVVQFEGLGEEPFQFSEPQLQGNRGIIWRKTTLLPRLEHRKTHEL